jgi:hypothetical protein
MKPQNNADEHSELVPARGKPQIRIASDSDFRMLPKKFQEHFFKWWELNQISEIEKGRPICFNCLKPMRKYKNKFHCKCTPDMVLSVGNKDKRK